MFTQISQKDAEQLINSGDIVIADVRDDESYHEGHIDNAIHLSMPALQEFCDSADKSKPIIVYCYHGISSQSVAQHLVDHGFSEVYSLIGGYEAWVNRQTSE